MILQGDCLEVLRTLPERSVHCCVTSPPYWGLRDYGIDGQIGLEETPDQYVQRMVEVFREVRRVLRDDGTLWLNLGDSYAADRGGTTPPAQTVAGGEHGKGGVKERRGQKDGYNPTRNAKMYGLKHKDLVGIPWRVAFALQADGWYLRSDIIWHKPNPMPESVTDRPTKAHEYIFLLTKSERYYYDHEAIKESAVGFNKAPIAGSKGAFGTPQTRLRKGNAKTFRGGGKYTGGKSFDNSKVVERESTGNTPNVTGLRNRRTVWTVATKPYKEAHFATYPPDLVKPCILAGAPAGGTVLDPFNGAGTTGLVAFENGREYIGIELNPEYIVITEKRLQDVQTKLF